MAKKWEHRALVNQALRVLPSTPMFTGEDVHKASPVVGNFLTNPYRDFYALFALSDIHLKELIALCVARRLKPVPYVSILPSGVRWLELWREK
jgi:hypothetical protein